MSWTSRWLLKEESLLPRRPGDRAVPRGHCSLSEQDFAGPSGDCSCVGWVAKLLRLYWNGSVEAPAWAEAKHK